MRIRVEVGDASAQAEVDVGRTIERGLNRLEELGRRGRQAVHEAVNGITSRVPRNRDEAVGSFNRLFAERWGVKLTPVEPAAPAAPGPRQPSRSASPKRRRKKKRR